MKIKVYEIGLGTYHDRDGNQYIGCNKGHNLRNDAGEKFRPIDWDEDDSITWIQKKKPKKKIKIKKYKCRLNDGKNVWDEYIPAISKKELLREWGGSVEFESIEEVPKCLPSAMMVRNSMEKTGFGKSECDLVYMILREYVTGTGI